MEGEGGDIKGRWRQQAHWVPMQDQDGTPRLLYARVCRPPGEAPARVVVINHGTGLTRTILEPEACSAEAPEWFLDRGYMVVMPLRRGYGATVGPVSEHLVVGPQGIRRCDDVQPAMTGLEAARDIAATVDYATALPGARPGGAVVLGVSTGGYATMAFNSVPHPKVVAAINVSGGSGGRFGGGLGQVCHADRMIDGAAKLGASASTPMLWFYARNDSYFSPDLGARCIRPSRLPAAWRSLSRPACSASMVIPCSTVPVGLISGGHRWSDTWRNGPARRVQARRTGSLAGVLA